MKEKKYKAVIFDLDGTLLDTLTDLADAVNHVLTCHGYEKRTRAQIRSYLGNGINRLCRLSLPKEISEEKFQQVFADFKEYYTAHCHIATKPYEGIPELLAALRQARYGMAIVSNKNEAAVRALQQDFFPDIAVVIGQNSSLKRKPAPDMVDAALEKLGISRGEAVYVGDSEVDKATADAARMDCILVAWGFRDREVIENLKAAAIAQKPADILELV